MPPSANPATWILAADIKHGKPLRLLDASARLTLRGATAADETQTRAPDHLDASRA
jgi:hypothetical protein